MTTLPTARQAAAVDEFLEELKTAAAPPAATGGLIFALAATASRQPIWDHACQVQGEMFKATTAFGGLDIQLVYYRGFGECKASRWVNTASELHRLMRPVSCVGGKTQIERVLEHAIRETEKRTVGALVFVGDAMEESGDRLCRLAGRLGELQIPVFVLHEGRDPDPGRLVQADRSHRERSLPPLRARLDRPAENPARRRRHLRRQRSQHPCGVRSTAARRAAAAHCATAPAAMTQTLSTEQRGSNENVDRP